MPTLRQEQNPADPSVDAGHWLDFDPEVGTILQTATHEGWSHDQLTGALQSSSAYAEVTGRRQALADPSQADDAKAQLGVQVSRMLQRPATDPTVAAAVDKLANGQATMAGIQAVMAPVGNDATLPERVIELAASHGIPMSPANAAQWTGMDEQSLDAQFGQMSQGLYPWKPPNIPYQQFASVFADMHGQETGTPIDPSDPNFQAMLEQSQGNLGNFRQIVRGSEQWQQSPKGQQAIAQRSSQLVQDMLNANSTSEEISRNQQTYEQQLAVSFGQSLQPLGPAAGPPSQQGGGGSSGGGGGGIVSSGGGRYSVGQAHGLSAAEAWIIQHESGGRSTAQNPSSTAYGIGQFLDSTWASTGISKTSDPELQLKAFRIYVSRRYGSAENAKAFWQAHHWY